MTFVLLAAFLGVTSGSSDFYKSHTPISNFDATKITIESVGEHPSLDFRIFYNYDGQRISPWHDIPMSAGTDEDGNKLYHFICEIPLDTTAKMEVNKEQDFNPIAQDTKKGKLRHYMYNPEEGSVCNYGAIMQTWEDPNHIDESTKAGGDNDPVDVLQINKRPCVMGELYAVKVLGTLAMVDDGETDWKMIVADVKDPATQHMKDINDVPVEKINELREWFRMYKTAEGKGENQFGMDEKAMDSKFSQNVLDGTYNDWVKLVDQTKEEL